jgi:hypothetical protein
MKKPLLFLLISLAAMPFARGQTHTQSISFDDGNGLGNAGTYFSTDHFSVDVYLTFNGYNSAGLSLWLETTANAAPFISLTGFTYGTTFPEAIQPFAGPLGFTYLQSTGLYTTPNPSDLGATLDLQAQPPAPPGTYFVGHLTVSLDGLAPGIYVLQTDATHGSPLSHRSVVTSYSPGDPPVFNDEPIPVSPYTITVIPEPGTVSLVGLSLGSLALALHRKKRTA